MTKKSTLKNLTCIISFLLIFSFIIPLANAQSSKFADVEKSHWAKPYIEKMALKSVILGKGAGIFAPEDKVTRYESVIMLVRILGHTDISSNKEIPDTFKGADKVPEWAQREIAVGVEEGIITGEDLVDFKGSEPAKRYEVAVFAVRALGLEEEAKNIKNIDLDFKDISKIPLAYRSYVQIAVEKGIITGFEDETFRPMESISRAQAATLFSRVDSILNRLTSKEEKGTLVEINTQDLPAITIKKDDGTLKNISVNNSTLIYKDWKETTLNDLKLGEYVIAILSSVGSYAEYIEIHDKEEQIPSVSTHTVTGTIKQVDRPTRFIILTLSSGAEMPYKIADRALIVLDNRVVDLDSLVFGQKTTVEINKDTGEIVSLKAEGVAKGLEGKVYSIFFGGGGFDSIITIKDEKGNVETHKISDNVVVMKDGKSSLLENVRNADYVVLDIKDSKVVKIMAESAEKTIRGYIDDISYITEHPEITIRLPDGRKEVCPIDNDVDITRNNRSAKLSDIKKGDKVSAVLTYGKATEIEADSVNRNLEGTIEGFRLDDDLSIMILTTDNTRETFIISPDARIRIDGEYKDIEDISLGMRGYYVDVRVESDVVIRMNIETKKAEAEIRGTVKHFNTDAMIIVVETELNIDGKKQTIDRVVFYDNDTLFVEGRDTVRPRQLDRYLEVGDTITIFGEYQVDGTFLAELGKW